MNNIDLATILLISSFVLIWIFVLIRNKIDNIFVCSEYRKSIKAVKHIFNFLQDFPYDYDNSIKEKYSSYSSILDDLQQLEYLRKNIFKEEKLRNYLVSLDNYISSTEYTSGKKVIVPDFDSRVQFNQERKKIRKVINYIIKCLEINKVS